MFGLNCVTANAAAFNTVLTFFAACSAKSIRLAATLRSSAISHDSAPELYRRSELLHRCHARTENFQEYGLAENRAVSRHMMADAMLREKERYAAAKHIICMSRWAARSVVERYHVSPENVHVIPAGSNFDAPNLAELTDFEPAPLTKVRLGFLGKDGKEKT